MAAQQQDFGFWAGDTLRLRFSIKNSAGQAVPLAGASLEWLLAPTRDGRDPLIQKLNGSGISISGNVATVSVEEAETIGMTAGIYHHQFRAVLVDGTAATTTVGTVTIHPIIHDFP